MSKKSTCYINYPSCYGELGHALLGWPAVAPGGRWANDLLHFKSRLCCEYTCIVLPAGSGCMGSHWGKRYKFILTTVFPPDADPLTWVGGIGVSSRGLTENWSPLFEGIPIFSLCHGC